MAAAAERDEAEFEARATGRPSLCASLSDPCEICEDPATHVSPDGRLVCVTCAGIWIRQSELDVF